MGKMRFAGLEKDTYKVVRQNVIDMILATEMTKHFEHLAKFVSVCNKPSSLDEAPVDGLVSRTCLRLYKGLPSNFPFTIKSHPVCV